MYELKRIGIVKRASAWLLDAILLAVLVTGFMFVISLICNFSGEQEKYFTASEQWEEFTEEYGESIAGYFGCTFEKEGDSRVMRKDGEVYSFVAVMNDFDSLNGEFDLTNPYAAEVANAYEVYKDFVIKPIGELYAQNNYLFSLLFMMVSVGVALAYLVLEFILPLIFKNGQTVGKNVFGICLVRANCVKMGNVQLFARTFIGKFAIETMFPVLLVFMVFFGWLGWLGIILPVALFALNAILFLFTKNKTPIHDILVGTVAVDSKIQVIFQSEEELVKTKTLQHLDSVHASKS